MADTQDFIDSLTDDLTPSTGVSPAAGRAILAGIAALTVAALVRLLGMRPDFASGHAHPVPLIAALVVLSAGVATAAAVTAMARPAVGASRNGWQWALAALAVLPVAAVLTAIGNPAQRAEMFPPEGPDCLILGILASVASVVALTLWLRRGAPTSPERAAWLVGIAGGSVGALSLAMCCPLDAITHIGTWHMGIIAVTAGVSRLMLPRFLRW